MSGLLTLSPEERVKIAEIVGLDPWDVDAAVLVAKAGELRENADRALAERAFNEPRDTTGILKTDAPIVEPSSRELHEATTQRRGLPTPSPTTSAFHRATASDDDQGRTLTRCAPPEDRRERAACS